MALIHTEPEYTMEELILLIKNEIDIDKNVVPIDGFIEYIGLNEKNINAYKKDISVITTKDIEDKAKKILEFLDVEAFVKFIIGKKYLNSGFYDVESEEFDTGVTFDKVLLGLNHPYDEEMKKLKKQDS